MAIYGIFYVYLRVCVHHKR